MDDFVDVKILKGTYDLDQIILNFHLSESLSSLNQFVKGVIRANFK